MSIDTTLVCMLFGTPNLLSLEENFHIGTAGF